ncbi:condensation domain-containing protein [Nocardia sp. NPDC001965]
MPDSLVQQADTRAVPGAVAAPGRSAAGRPVPLSLSQQAALLPERLRAGQGGSPVPNLFVAVEITGGLDVAALDRAARALLTEHEILRSVFPDDRRMPYQQPLPEPESVLEIAEGVTDEAALVAALAGDAGHRFDPVRRIPLRMRLYRLSGRDVLTVAVHPVAADNAGLDLIVTGLFAHYTGESVPAAGQYREYAAAQLRNLAATAADDPALAYWTDRLAGVPERTPVITVGAGGGLAHRTVELPAETLAALAAPGVESAPLLASAAAALRAAGLGDDIVVGLADPARTAQSAAVIGNFTNYLAIRLDAAGGTARDSIARAAAAVATAREHAGPRIERLTHLLRGHAVPAEGGLFQALVQIRTGGPLELEGHGLSVREIGRQVARPYGVDIVFDIVPAADGSAAVHIVFPPQLAGRPEIDTFASGFAQRATAWAADPDTPIGIDDAAPALFAAAAGFVFMTSGLGGPPQSEPERVIAAAIRTVLDLDEDDEVGREDTFFSLGGDSIAALRMVTDLADQGYSLDVQTVFGHPAVHDLARQLERAEAGADAGAEAGQAPTISPMGASGLDAATLSALGKKFGAR